MDLISPNLKLPYLAPAQAQKHVTHNEALRQLDAIVQLSVNTIAGDAPAAPDEGERYIVAASAEGTFIGQANNIAAFQDGAWAFLIPQIGWQAYVQDAATIYIFDGTAWQANASGNSGGDTDSSKTASKFGINSTADETNRLSVKSSAVLLDNEGAGHQLKINKSAAANTASLLFQSGYTGHAEMGLTGGTDFHIKTSADGGNFRDSLIADAQSGAISTPFGLNPQIMTTPTTLCGGPDSYYGLPSANALVTGRSNLNLTKDRINFTAVYVDRESVLEGGLVAQYSAASTAGAVMRSGIYQLGTANGSDWDLGQLIHDFGTVTADDAGHKFFEAAQPVVLPSGWYAFAVGVNSAGAAVRYVQSRQPGLGYMQLHSSGTSADIRFGGPTSYMLESNCSEEITNGLPQTWQKNPVKIVASTNSFAYNVFIPKWAVGG